jgi:hypothetical protein
MREPSAKGRRPAGRDDRDLVAATGDSFAAENAFYLNAAPSRFAKFLAHAKLYEMSVTVPGHFVEVGVFRGASFSRFRKLGALLHPDHHRKFLGFDVFGAFPEADYAPDKAVLTTQHAAYGDRGIDRAALLALLRAQGLAENVELIEGDICKTLPSYLAAREELSVAIANIDVDLYEPTRIAIEQLFPRVPRGGVVVLDDYEGFPGAKRAIDEYLAAERRPERLAKFPFAHSPCYLIKE